MLVCVFYLHVARETAGAARTRLSLRPRLARRVKDDAILGRVAPRDRGSVSTHNVVPANAGTHNHRPVLLRESRRPVRRSFSEGGTASPKTSDTAYGSRRRPGVRRDDVELNSPCSCAAAEGERRSLRLCLAVLVELRNIGPEVVDLFLVLDAGKRHLGAGDLRLGVLDVFLELRLVPGDARILVGVGVGIIRRGAGLAAVEPVQLRADLVLGAFADRVAGQAFVERGLAGRDVLRKGRG